ncbi:tyrosine--tRNA ligase [Paramaledivibacter caminithermalis]|jgi:tyrosyl-tRNA synthetase|uniref:Tyrosine--tRNA ligase n=1 Tax=Paramaledivibacter caminithermalis (strain DSM 15212 / CIP 107654 / DViRD3) TaxID=1121301 RepID=A0A1M6Q2G0_PARC5|nr:tyrosine--tRNA ligase [Paramaledivibacter caminithermalis]SHK14384.1 tyrosyl-tRNA synthetase [Paramaledivibacter caminithermalis DSM 15212]
MKNVFDVLVERGYIKQTTHEDEIRELLGKESVTFYTGYDPTADSLHVGHFLQVMVMAHMQKAGHRPIFLIGGGTTMVGDPSGKTDMRKMLTREQIEYNGECFKKQVSNMLDFSEGKAIMVNNADWLMNLEYIPFLREIGKHFSVNRMLTAECYKARMEKGLSFLEFNYMIMQSYDFLQLHERYGCKLQLGGDDQWSNIISGVDLIRRIKGEPAYGMTFTLLTNSQGKKMGKTEAGAIWLDPKKTSPYDFYQYWRNVDDADVEKCLSLLTFLPMEEVRRLGALEGSEINKAKEILAFEVTKLVHGEEEAQKAQQAARALFGKGANMENIPFTEISKLEIGEGIDVLSLLTRINIVSSRGEGRRLIQQNGLSIENEKVKDINLIIKEEDFKDGKLLVRKGKKVYHQVRLV